MFGFIRGSRLLALMAVLILAGAAYAFAASNTVPATSAGQGSGAISGYTVTLVVYNLNATTPANIDSVNFTLSAAATSVKMSVTPGTYYTCNLVSGNNWTCPTTSPQATVAGATTLDIIAKNN